MFDNGSSPAVEPLSRALVLNLDETRLRVTLRHSYTHAGLLAASQGSVQTLPNGNLFVGWGAEVDRGRLLAGAPGEPMAAVSTAARSGFETTVATRIVATRFAVTALDAAGNTLGQSPQIAVSSA